MATYSNLFIDQGSNFTSVIDETGDLDLTNYSAIAKIAKSYDGTVKSTFTTSIDIATSKITISLTAAQTAALKPGRYVYDVIITDDSSPVVVTRVLEGQIHVTPGVTFDASAPEV
jgi:hypothetical protein